MFRNYKIKNYNIILILAVIGLTILGILVIGSADRDNQIKQILGMALGLLVMVVVSLVDYEFVLRFYWLWYIAVIGLLLLVLVIGDDSHGAQRWIEFGVRFQPSELSKVLLVLFFARFLMDREEDLNTLPNLIFSGVLAVIPLLLILKEPDLSTTIVTFLIIFTMLFTAGLSYKLIGVAAAIVVPFVTIVLVLIARGNEFILKIMGYQSLRILAWMYPEDYPQSSYQQQNSIMAIGSGQLIGKGLNNNSLDSVKNGNYISEPHTDFIFAVAGEELGFIGSVFIVILIMVIVFECLRMAKRAKDKSGELICVGMAALIAFQSFVNICVVTGLFPNTGLTLPFVSYGLTSLMTLYFGIGFVLNVGLQGKKSHDSHDYFE